MKVKIVKNISILTELYNIVTAKNNMHNIFNITYLKSKIKNRDNVKRNKTILSPWCSEIWNHKIDIQRRKEKDRKVVG